MPAARSTFREKAGSVCWQKQLRDRYIAEGTPPVPHLDVKRAVVRPVSRRLAEQVILKYEWLGTMASTSHHFGIFFGTYCAGVTCVAVNGVGTAGVYRARAFGIHSGQLATLARGACVHWAPTGTNSRLVAWTVRLLAALRVAKLLIAYSDSDAGEIGTIYQACGWAYVGKTEQVARPDMQVIAPNGRIFDMRLMSKMAKEHGVSRATVRETLISKGWKLQAGNPKHKYASILDRSDAALVARVERMRLPYPKRPRAGSAVSGTPATHAGGGGATPTPALSTDPTR